MQRKIYILRLLNNCKGLVEGFFKFFKKNFIDICKEGEYENYL